MRIYQRNLVWCLRNSYTFAAMDFGRRLGASDEHIPQWICKERATTPPPKRHAALRVALKLAWGFVARSVEYRWGYTPSFAPRPRPISAQRMYSYFGDTTLASLLSFLRMPWDHEPSLFSAGADVRRLTFISDGNVSLLTSAPTRFIDWVHAAGDRPAWEESALSTARGLLG